MDSGWVRTRRMGKDTTDGQGYNGWLRKQLTEIQNMFFIIQMLKAFCYGCSNLRITPKIGPKSPTLKVPETTNLFNLLTLRNAKGSPGGNPHESSLTSSSLPTTSQAHDPKPGKYDPIQRGLLNHQKNTQKLTIFCIFRSMEKLAQMDPNGARRIFSY